MPLWSCLQNSTTLCLFKSCFFYPSMRLSHVTPQTLLEAAGIRCRTSLWMKATILWHFLCSGHWAREWAFLCVSISSSFTLCWAGTRVSICYPGQQAYRMQTNMVMVKLCPTHLTPKSILAIPPPKLTRISSETYVCVLPQIVTLSFQTQELPRC